MTNYILDYDLYQQKLADIYQMAKGKLVKEETAKTELGYPVDYFTLGKGNNHIILMGGTHGSEIISVDFMLKLMEKMVKGGDEFQHFPFEEYTFHFIPLQNPEGFIISTSAIRTKITNDTPLNDMEKICKDYYLKYRQDDIHYKEDPNDRSLKEHQKMFADASYQAIDQTKHPLLHEAVKRILTNKEIPAGSMIMWRANGLGIELNRNQPFNLGLQANIENERTYGYLRYNNIPTNVPSPIGVPSLTSGHLVMASENKFLMALIDKLYHEKKYCGLVSYHGTGGVIYYRPSFQFDETVLDDEHRHQFTAINRTIADKYREFTDYKLVEDNDLEGTDEFLRMQYPGQYCIELSKMGGNPIGPYGDLQGNYDKTINDNMLATSKTIPYMALFKPFIYEEGYLINPNQEDQDGTGFKR